MGMNDFAREEKMQKIFDDRDNTVDEVEESGEDNNILEKEKSSAVINNHSDNNNSRHNEEKVSFSANSQIFLML